MVGWLVVAGSVAVGAAVVRRLRRGGTAGVYSEQDHDAVDRTRAYLRSRQRPRF